MKCSKCINFPMCDEYNCKYYLIHQEWMTKEEIEFSIKLHKKTFGSLDEDLFRVS